MSSYLDILKSLQESPTSASFTSYTPAEPQENSLRNIYSTKIELGQKDSVYSEKESFIEYIPFKRKVVSYEEHVYKQKVPHFRKVNDQIQKIVLETVPRQRTQTDYYAVEHLRYYQKQIIPEKSIEYVPVVRTVKRTQLVPVQRKIVHYPKDVNLETLKNQNKQILTIQSKEKDLIYERTPSFSSKFYEKHHEQVQEKPFVSLGPLVQSVTAESPIKLKQFKDETPIKSFPQQSSSKIQSKLDYINQNEEKHQLVQDSILSSLSKAYQVEVSVKRIPKQRSFLMRDSSKSPTNRKRNIVKSITAKKYQIYSRPITKYEEMKNFKPSTLNEMNYRSTETIDSRNLKFI